MSASSSSSSVATFLESIKDQTPARQQQLFKNAVSFADTAAGVKIQRVPASVVARILKPYMVRKAYAQDPNARPDYGECIGDLSDDLQADPLVQVIYDFENIFSAALQKKVDMFESLVTMATLWNQNGSPSQACLIVAWKVEHGARRPVVVGAATVIRAYMHDDLATTQEILSDRDFEKVQPLLRAKSLLIDTMSSTQKGVGRVLLLHCIRYAMMRKMTGVLALSYAGWASNVPESKKLFEFMEFEKVVTKATFKVQGYHGSWFFLPISKLPLHGIVEKAVRVCARRGLTAKTRDALIWRCPN